MVKKRKAGFTLIELVVVIAILGVLAGIAVPRFLESTAAARGARIVDDLRTIDGALQTYNIKMGKYPAKLEYLVSTETGAEVVGLLAALPVPPRGKFIVAQGDGTGKGFQSADTAYGITDGRATYRCSLGAGTVEWYLGNGSGVKMGSSFQQMIDATTSAMGSVGKVTGGNQINNAIAAQGGLPAVDSTLLNQLGLTGNYTWHVDTNWGGSNLIYFASNVGNNNGSFSAALVVYDGVLYQYKGEGNATSITGTVGSGNIPATLKAKGFVEIGKVAS